MQDEGQKDNSDKPSTDWVFNATASDASSLSDSNTENNAPNTRGGVLVSWSASEYIGNPKNTAWFAMLGAASIGTAIIVYLLTNDLISVIVIIILAITVGIFAARQPHVLEYSLDKTGIHRAERFYPYESFKSFSVFKEGAFSHVYLSPLKRFAPPLAIHYSPEDEDKIINIFSDYLPYEEQKRDIIENFSRRIKF